MISVFATAPTIDAAVSTAARVSAAFRGYLRSSQAAAKIPDDKRVAIQVVNKAGDEDATRAAQEDVPIVVLLAVLLATVALVFARDNTERTQAPALVVPDTGAPAAAAVAATAAAAEQRTAAVEHSRFRPERQRAPGPRLGS